MAGAVFLSYAREDTAAALRIADALRGEGVQVWFDQSELRGGDAWDTKIRRQIKECALFIPLISARTDARAEGYFRLEWKLAVDRSHLVADDTPFILPVVVDDTSEAAARVPEKFREVHWTRILLNETPAEFAGRAARLISGETTRAPGATGASAARRTGRRRLPAWTLIAAAFGLFAGAFYLSGVRSGSPAAAAAPTPTPESEAQQLAEKARGYYYSVQFSRADLAVAADLARRATESDPNSAFAWGVRADVQASYIQRNWAFDAQIRQDTEAFAKRALAINPNEPQALLALGFLLNDQGAYGDAESFLRRALAEVPEDNRIRRILGVVVVNSGRFDEGIAILKEAVRRQPKDALAHYDLAIEYFTRGTGLQGQGDAYLKASLQEFDASLAIQPIDGAYIQKARLVAALYGDLVSMQAQLGRLSEAGRTEDRAVSTAMDYGLMKRDLGYVLAASALNTDDYFEDLVVAAPKAWLLALAYREAGKANLARQQWEAAEAVLRKRIREHPESERYRAQLAMTLAWLGRLDEANQEMAPLEAAWREQLDWQKSNWLARYYAALGDAPRAVAYIRLCVDSRLKLTRWSLTLDPWWDKLRGNPEFDALLVDRAQIATAK
jgi:tetratricopeptide (TPR) repeat protein